MPVCKVGKLQATDTKHAEAACRPAIIGTGHATAGIEFAESPEIDAKSKIIAFNGGVKGGVTTLYIHAYITVPTPAAIVSTVKITKIHKGRYGTLAITTIPKIAGGAGSVKHLDLKITRKGVLQARCTDGKLQARGSAHFTDGTKLSAAVVRTCTPKPWSRAAETLRKSTHSPPGDGECVAEDPSYFASLAGDSKWRIASFVAMPSSFSSARRPAASPWISRARSRVSTRTLLSSFQPFSSRTSGVRVTCESVRASIVPATRASVESFPIASRATPEMPLRAEAGIFSQSDSLKKARSVAR